jgi:hypothetical protein
VSFVDYHIRPHVATPFIQRLIGGVSRVELVGFFADFFSARFSLRLFACFFRPSR